MIEHCVLDQQVGCDQLAMTGQTLRALDCGLSNLAGQLLPLLLRLSPGSQNGGGDLGLL
ncbi:hypothetical protein D3C76_1399060 [compost metagenome]